MTNSREDSRGGGSELSAAGSGARRSQLGAEGWIVIFALLVGAALRLWDLSGPGLSHPEIYIPGIDLPAFSEPPPRHGFLETLSWHFEAEPHPLGYYLAMWGWTSIFGDSELSLRLPGALVGILTIWLFWRMGRSIFPKDVAAVATLLFSLHGFHIYWSHWARMYAPVVALSVLATWLLAILMRSGARRPGLEAGYVASLVAGTQTSEIFWAVPFLHLAWAALVAGPEKISWKGVIAPWAAPAARITQLQAIALALAAPGFVHAVLTARGAAVPPPDLRFLFEYLGFGFLFGTVLPKTPLPDPSMATAMAMAIVCAGLAGFGMRVESARLSADAPRPMAFSRLVLAAAAGMLIAGFAAVAASRRNEILALIAILPALCLWLPGLAAAARPTLRRIAPAAVAAIDRLQPFNLLLAMLVVCPLIVFYAVSFKVPLLANRAFLLFSPFLLLLATAGLMRLARPARFAATAAIIALFLVSVVFYLERPSSPRDYKAIAAALSREAKDGDLIFVRKRDWEDSPLFYYLPDAAYVVGDHEARLAELRPARVWLVEWRSKTGVLKTDARRDALDAAGYAQAGALTALQARATLYLAAPPAE